MLNSVLLFYLLRRAQSDQDTNHKQSCVWIFGIVVACAPVKEEPKGKKLYYLPNTQYWHKDDDDQIIKCGSENGDDQPIGQLACGDI